MELSWSTFLLEIVNFLVLVWLLKRFFYKPVLDAIGRRRAGIERTLTDAEALHKEAEALRQQYQNRLAVWEQERQAARAALAKEMGEERARELAALREALDKEREKAQVLAERRAMVERQQVQEMALAQGAQFAARLLSQAAGPELELRLLDLLVEEVDSGSPERFEQLRDAASHTPERVIITSAYPLVEDNRRRLERSLGLALGIDSPFAYEQDPRLLAGLRVSIGAWVLRANLQDELKAFVDSTHEA